MGAKTVNYRTSRAETIRGYRSRSIWEREREKERRIGKGQEGSAWDRRGSIIRAETQNRARAIGELKLRHAIYMATETIEVEWRWWRPGGRQTGRVKGKGGREKEKRKRKKPIREKITECETEKQTLISDNKMMELLNAMHERLISHYKYRVKHRARRKNHDKSKFIYLHLLSHICNISLAII